MIYMKTFDESIESEKEIFKLCNKLVPEIVDGFVSAINQALSSGIEYVEDQIIGDGNGFASYLTPKSIVESYRSKFLEPFYKFIKDTNLSLFVVIGPKDESSRKYSGLYSKGNSIQVYIDNLNFRKDLVDLFKKYNQLSRIKNSFIKMFEKSRSFQTLIHEFVHAYDDFISSGKYMPQEYKSLDRGYEWGEYASQNLEVNARYISSINSLEQLEMRYYADFDRVIEQFKMDFEGWHTISKDQQKRILNRLYAWYNQPVEKEKEKKKALKYIYNDASFRQLYELGDKRPLTNEVKIPQNLKGTSFNIDLISYMKESADQLVSGNYDKKEFKNSSIIRNRYKGFKVIKSILERMEKMQSKIDKMPYLADTLQSQREDFKFMVNELERKLGLSTRDLSIIASRFKD